MKLPEKWVTHLAAERETGMGYQICRITDQAMIHEGVIVYDCEELDNEDVDVNTITDIEVTH